MSGKIDHDIELERAQPLQQRAIVETGKVEPFVGERLQPLRCVVARRLQRDQQVAVARAIERRQQAGQKDRNRTRAESGRKPADAQRAAGSSSRDGTRPWQNAQMPFRERSERIEQRAIVLRWIVVHQHQYRAEVSRSSPRASSTR